MVEDRDGRPSRGPDDATPSLYKQAVHCWEVLGMSGSLEREVLSVLSYPSFCVCMFFCIVFVFGLF